MTSQEKCAIHFSTGSGTEPPWAMFAAKATSCAAAQKQAAFWRLHDYVFEHQGDLNVESIRATITNVVKHYSDVDQKQFSNCVDQDLASSTVMRDVAAARRLGITGTPTFFINGIRKSGAPSAEAIRMLIEQASTTPAVRGDVATRP